MGTTNHTGQTPSDDALTDSLGHPLAGTMANRGVDWGGENPCCECMTGAAPGLCPQRCTEYEVWGNSATRNWGSRPSQKCVFACPFFASLCNSTTHCSRCHLRR